MAGKVANTPHFSPRSATWPVFGVFPRFQRREAIFPDDIQSPLICRPPAGQRFRCRDNDCLLGAAGIGRVRAGDGAHPGCSAGSSGHATGSPGSASGAGAPLARPGFGGRSRARAARRGRQHLNIAEREGQRRPRGCADAGIAGRLAVPGFLRRFLQGTAWRGRRWRRRFRPEGAVARLRLRCRRGARDYRHQQSRDCRCGRDRSQFHRWLEAEGGVGRHRHEDRYRGAEGRPEGQGD